MPRGFGAGMGCQTRGFGRNSRNNSSPNCRTYPWLPRRWWAAEYQNAAMPQDFPGVPAESDYLQEQSKYLKKQLAEIEKRLQQLEKKEPGKEKGLE